MSPTLNATHDPNRRSWVESANAPSTPFPIQNLPFGAFRIKGAAGQATCGVAIGDAVIDVGAVSGHMSGAARGVAEACRAPTLNDAMQAEPAALSEFRQQLSDLLMAGNEAGRRALSGSLHAQDAVDLVKPVAISGFVDYFASIDHATNAGRMFRPDEPLFANYKYVPIGYNGRASSIVVSGTGITHPFGQIMKPQASAPVFDPSAQLDYEVELGIYIGRASTLGQRVGIAHAWSHVFGLSLLNDWSARDIQAWEYRPLGPFLGKSFGTTVAPWIVTAEALLPYRTSALKRPATDPAPLPHLFSEADARDGGLDVQLECYLTTQAMRARGDKPVLLGKGSATTLYWTIAQMVTHQTSNGANLQVGDLLGTGTISGPTPDSLGSLLEITARGTKRLDLPGGEQRGFLEDGDEITIVGWCERDGYARIGLGECKGHILPPVPLGA